MLKSFKGYIRESKNDEKQVLKDLLSNSLISRAEFYRLAKESKLLLHAEDFDHRYTVSLNVYAKSVHPDNLPDQIEWKIDSIEETKLLYTVHHSAHRYIAEIASNLGEQELIRGIQFLASPNYTLELEVTEIELH